MSETFKDLVEASFGSMMASAGKSLGQKIANTGKQYALGFLADLGSARAAGKLDFNVVFTDLKKTWKRYIAQQKLVPSPATFVEFMNTVFGMKMDEETISRAVFGYQGAQAPRMVTPNAQVLKQKFSTLVRNNVTENQISTTAADLARYAENDERDEAYVVAMLKFIANKKPELLKNPAMSSLTPYMNGGRMNDQDVDKVLGEVAKLLLKRDVILKRMEAEAKNGTAAPDTAAPTNNGGKIDVNPPSSAETGNWNGLQRPDKRAPIAAPTEVLRNMQKFRMFKASALETFFKEAENDSFWNAYFTQAKNNDPHIVNALSAQLMQLAVRYSRETFVKVMVEQQNKNIGQIAWPQANIIAAYDFVRYGGNVDEVTAELNHFLNNRDKAAYVFIAIFRYLAKQWIAKNGDDE